MLVLLIILYTDSINIAFILGIPERQSTERGSSEKVQRKETGNLPTVEEEDQEGSTQP